MKYITYLIIIFTILNNNTYATDLEKILKDDFNSTLEDFNNIPKIINLSHLFYTSQIIIADAIIINNDQNVREYVQSHKCSCNENLISFVNYIGQAYAFPLLIYGTGIVADNPSWRKTGRLLAESLILSFSITQTTKMILGRSRPFNNDGPYEFKFFEFVDKYWSHPSGHTTLAFTFATILSFRINTWWSYPTFYTLAAGTAFARMYYDKHWLSDVFLGAAIGTASSLLILKSSEKKDTKPQNSNLLIQPSFNFINFTYSW